MLGILLRAARALAESPADADDAELARVLGQEVLPAFGDVIWLYTRNEAGAVQLAGVAAPGAAPEPGTGAEVHAEIVTSGGADDRLPGLLVVGAAAGRRSYDAADRAAVDVLATLVGARWAVREQVSRAAELRQRLDGVALAGRELAHRLNNDLTMPVGVVELMLDRNPASPDLREMLEAAAHDLTALETHIRAFHDVMRELTGGSEG